MNAQSKKLTQLAASILMAMAVGNVYSANDIYIEGVGNYNESNLDVTGNGTPGANVKIDQVSSATLDTEKNYVGKSDNELTIAPTGATIVRIGQGAFYNPLNTDTAPTTVTNGGGANLAGAHGNTVTGTIANGTVVVNQTSSHNTVNFTGTGVTGSGAVTVNQGFQGAAGGGGSGFTANIAKSGTGSLTIEQGTAALNTGSGGLVNVIQGTGSSSVSITQLASANAGIVSVNTKGSGGSLAINQTNEGRTYVNATGAVADTQVDNAALTTDQVLEDGAATITGDVKLVNDMTLNGSSVGKLVLKNGKGDVEANVTGVGGTVIIDSNGGTNNKIYINKFGAANDAVINSVSNGPLSVTGSLTVAQSNNDNSTIAVKGIVAVSGIVDISQTGSNQVATFTSKNGSSGNYYLSQEGSTSGSVINVDF